MRKIMFLAATAALVAVGAGCGGDGTTIPDTETGRDAGGGDSAVLPDGDGSQDATADAGSELPPRGEDLYLVYTQEATSVGSGLPDYVQLMVVEESCRPSSADLCEPGACAPVEIAPRSAAEPLCRNGCAVTGNLSHVVFLDPADPRVLRAAPLGADFQLTGDSVTVATDVRAFQVRQQTVAYRVEQDLRVANLATGTDTVVGAFSNANGGYTLSADATTLFLNDVVSLTAMTTTVIDVATGNSSLLYTFVSGERMGTGSFYSGREPMAVSPDGTRVGVVTSGRTSGFQCSSNADCTGPGEACLTSATPPRCVRQELALNIINLADAALLDTACFTDVDCGADHTCDTTALDADGAGRCLPGQFSLGPTGPNRCTNLTAGQYSELRGQLAWRSNQTLIAVLGQDCIRGNIPVTDLVALNLSGGAAFERVIENPGADHGGDDCYDETEVCWDPAACAVEISTASFSDTGHTSALVADSISSQHKNELWIIDAWGRGGKELVTRSIDFEVLSVSLHAR